MIPLRLLSRAAVAGAALVAVVLAYAPALRGQFQFDDFTSIQVNYAIRGPARVLAELQPGALLGPARPVTDLVFALAHAAGGVEPLPYHLASLGLHLATLALAFVLVRGALRRLGLARAEPLAALVAVAFALHPLQAESVCYASQLAEVLSSALCLAALLLLIRAYDAATPSVATGWALGATVVTALAMGAKAIAVTVPAAFLLWAVALGRREGDAAPAPRRAGRALLLGAGAWALALGAVARNLLQLGPGATAGLHAGALGPWRYLLTQLRVHWHYARLLAWPSGQSVDPAFTPSPAWPDAATFLAGLASLGILAGAAWAAVGAGRTRSAAAPALRAIAFGIAWWYLQLAPTSSLIPIDDLVAEHRVYLALLGPLLAVAVAVEALLGAVSASPRARAAAAAGGVAVCAALGIALSARAAVWATQLALWRDAAEKDPSGQRAAGNYALALHEAGMRDEAVRAYQRAQALARTPRQVADVARNLSALYLEAGDLPAALSVLEMGLAAVRHDFELRAALANTLRQVGRLDEAQAEARWALAIAPNEPEALDALGLVLLDQGDAEQALAQFQRAAAIDPSTLAYTENALVALERLGRRPEACAAWTKIRASGGTKDQGAQRAAARLACGR
jgi:protein O-mannosyl-transferase